MKVKAPNSKSYYLRLVISSKYPVELVIKGFEKYLPKIVYFQRGYGDRATYLFKGTQNFIIPLPIKPTNLIIEAIDKTTRNSKGIDIKALQVLPLKRIQPEFRADLKEFTDFAKYIAKNSPYLKKGVYSSKNKMFQLEITDTIIDSKGNIINTVAMVNHSNGNIWVRPKEFNKLTVSQRVMVLYHEICHFIHDTENEFECDRIALDMFLADGFAPSEVIYSLANLFGDKSIPEDEKQKRVEALFKILVEKNK